MVEVVTQIKVAEEQAEEIKRSARQQARKLQDEAVAAGGQLVEAETQRAATEAAQMISQANARAQAYLSKWSAQSAGACEQLLSDTQANMKKATTLIVERIVESL